MTTLLSQPESLATSSDVLGNEDYFDPLNCPEKWTPGMSKPWGFDSKAQVRFQKAIDRIVGLSHGGHSIIKLEWAPDVYEWRPYALGSNPTGYTLPYWLALWDVNGNEVAAPRWVLHERGEPEQYLPGWENDRWVMLEGKMHDAKGDPPPDGIYTRWHRHIAHHSACCSRTGNEDDCWGFYVEPNEDLLQYIGKMAWQARNDKEIDPTKPVALLKDNRSGNNRTEKKLEKNIVHTQINITPRFKRSPYLWLPEGN